MLDMPGNVWSGMMFGIRLSLTGMSDMWATVVLSRGLAMQGDGLVATSAADVR